jgi:DNA-3-methyladenine glycosylase II
LNPAQFQHALRTAERHLLRVDPRFSPVLQRAGPCTLKRVASFRPFDALLGAITSQQLSGKAAATILARVKARVNDGRFPTPEQVLRARLPSLRACGLSRAKAVALKDLAQKTLDGTVPPARELHRLDDEAIIARVTQVRGIGRWTVEMMLMFRLGRLDVMPVDDLGVRKGFGVLSGAEALPTRKALLEASTPWAPFRTVASWYLWRVLDV